jgi:alkyldihydroxyacetonephosphate synthase
MAGWIGLVLAVAVGGFLLWVAAQHRSRRARGNLPQGSTRVEPGAPPVDGASDAESFDVWGFNDTRFQVDSTGTVEISGSRYELSGKKLPSLFSWFQGVIDVPLDPADKRTTNYGESISPSRAPQALREALAECFAADQISDDDDQRLRHGHGHTQEEMYAIKYGAIARIPDLVVWPGDEDQVVSLMQIAEKLDACLIPFGGGTNVTDALRCPVGEERPIISVDMRRMNRVLWIDAQNRMACVQAGAVGRHVMEQLAEHGFTMGHEPDSVEFSTLGGWISTHASGMKKNRYGNIEDIVLDYNLVTPGGKIARSSVAPRESVGVDARRFILGSEGSFGIITQAVVRLFPMPEVQEYGSVLFPSFEQGVGFMYDLAMTSDVPASVRLVDNLQFQFGAALKPKPGGVGKLLSKLQKLWVLRVLGFKVDEMVVCTLVFEGDREEVRRQEATVYRIAKQHGGFKAGPENGRRGYQLTFSIAYIRDFVMNHWVLAESFETSMPWDRVLDLCKRVKARVNDEHRKRDLPGRPFISCRVTQIYPTGVCVYFYMAYYYKGVENPSHVFSEMEKAARAEILAAGGSLSHHHGIGKHREGFLPEIMSPALLEWNRRAKHAVDPGNLFAAANQGLGRKREQAVQDLDDAGG